MWYAWLEAQRAFMRTWNPWLGSARQAFARPSYACAAPYLGEYVGHAAGAASSPPGFDITAVTIGGDLVPVVEEIVDDTPFCVLRKFTRWRAEPADSRPPVFLCPPLAGHHAVMLRETVETLLLDRDVFVADWANARDVPLVAGDFGLDDYVRILERFFVKANAPDLHVLAVCQATVPALAAAALLAAQQPAVHSLTLMGGPIDAREHPTMIDHFALGHDLDWFRRTVIDIVPPPHPGAGRRVYPGFLQHAAIIAAHPQRHLALEGRYWAAWLAHDFPAVARSARKVAEYGAVLDMTEHYFLDTLRVIFQDCLLATHAWRIGERLVDPQTLAASALCTIEGDRDDITGAGQTHAAQLLCPAIADTRRQCLTIEDCDHYDLFIGPRWRTFVHPTLECFWTDLDMTSNAVSDGGPRSAGSRRPPDAAAARST